MKEVFKFQKGEVIINDYKEKFLITDIIKETTPFYTQYLYKLLDCKHYEYSYGLKSVIETEGYFKRFSNTLDVLEVRHKETRIVIDTLIIRNYKYLPLDIRYYDYLQFRLRNYCKTRNLNVDFFELY